MCTLNTRVRVLYERSLEERPLSRDARDKFCLETEIVISKYVRLGAQRAKKICVLYHGEQRTIGDDSQNGVIYVNVLSSALVNLCRAMPPLRSVEL